MSNEIYIGIMSGTSLDGVDVAVVDFAAPTPNLLFAHTYDWQTELQQPIADLCQPGDNEIQRLGELDVRIGRYFAQCVNHALGQSGLKADAVSAIGSHGQTLRHHPHGDTPFTLQAGDANIIAYETGVTTVADFRRADMAAGGQGAPLVPAFHQHLLQEPGKNRVILNIGGIANITLLPADPNRPVIGFDTGPGNGLLNTWIQRHQGKEYDKNGDWADSGTVHNELLQQCLADDYFHQPAPKSTGREHFNLNWIEAQIRACGAETIPAEDVQATLSQLTAESIHQHIAMHTPECEEILVCGGGWHNRNLISRLTQLTHTKVDSTASAGVDPDFMEAICFAWLAKQRLNNNAGNLCEVTGARQPVILGGIYAPPPKKS